MSRDFRQTSIYPPPGRSNICVATTAYTAQESDEVSFEVGDLIRLSYQDDRLSIGKKLFGDRKSGCFPTETVRIIHPSTAAKNTYCKTLFDHEAKHEDELSFGEREFIIILNTNGDEGWMKGKLLSDGKVGVFPMNYVRFLTDHEAELELMLLREKEEQRLLGNESGKEADNENVKPGSNLKDPEIVLKNDHRQEASNEMVKEKDSKVVACLSFSDDSTGRSDKDRGSVKEDASTELPSLSSKDNDVFPTISKAEVKLDGLGMNDGNGMGDKTATPQASADKNMVPRMQEQSSGDEFIAPQDAQRTPSELSKKDNTAKNDRIVHQHGVSEKQQLVRNVPSSIIFPIVNNPAVLDYEFHIEEDENSTRAGCTSYTAIVKWTVKTCR